VPDIRDRKVLVTGADGFIGSHLTERLVSEGADVRALCMYNSQGSFGWLDESWVVKDDAAEIVLGDIRDERRTNDLVRGAEVVFHLAALVGIPYSYVAPGSYVDTNIRGTHNVLEACRAHDVGRLIQTSTSEVYGTPDSIPIRESHPLQAQSPYSATKIAADKLCEAYARSFGTPVVILRPFNTYGPRQSARAVLITILTQLLRGRQKVALGNLSPRRDMTYVDDTVDAFVRAAGASLGAGEVIQLGTGKTYAVQEMFDIACSVLGVSAQIEVDEQRSRPADSEVQVLLSDPKAAQLRLGWTASTDLAAGVRLTAEWLRGSLGRYKSDQYTV
jgi:UDP-glucose 4-epimerase